MSNPPIPPDGGRSEDGFALVGDVMCPVCEKPLPRSTAWPVADPDGGTPFLVHRQCVTELRRRLRRGERPE